jgi:hypothetical protein
MLRFRRAATAFVLAAAGVTAAALPAQQAGAASGSVFLYKIYYNSPGSDTGSNASLDAEYVQIANTTSANVSLKGWTLTDASRHVYTFGTYTLGAHRSVVVHTGKGGNTAAHRYQGRSWYVWNNDKDTATLRRSTGSTVDTCSYNSTRVAYKMC